MEALRIHVERLVRPIRAYGGRKNKMREELLAHLEQRVSDARERGLAEDDAIALAIEGMGDPAQLRAELQATIPTIERLSFVHLPVDALDAWFDKRDGETAAHYAWTRAVCTVVFVLFVLVPIIAVTDGANWLQFLTGDRAWNWGDTWVVKSIYAPILIVCGLAIASFITYWLADLTGIRRRMSKRTAANLITRIISVEVFFCGHVALIAALTVFAAYLTVRPDSDLVPLTAATFDLQSIALILAPSLALLLLAGFPFVAWSINKEHERYERWGRLRADQ